MWPAVQDLFYNYVYFFFFVQILFSDIGLFEHWWMVIHFTHNAVQLPANSKKLESTALYLTKVMRRGFSSLICLSVYSTKQTRF